MNTKSNANAGSGCSSHELFGWLRGKLADAEKSLRSREAMANPTRVSEEEWEALKARPGTIMTKGRKLSKAALKEMEEEPLRHKRIAVKCRHEVEMFRAVIAALEGDSWTQTPPKEGGLYWLWGGDPDESPPFPVTVMQGGSPEKCWIAPGQWGWNRAQDFDEWPNAWWKPCVEPSLPNEALCESAKQRPASPET